MRMTMKKILFVMIDGFGDLNLPSNEDSKLSDDFFSKTHSPTISKYFISPENSYYGLMDPVEPGIACGSDTAHLSLFGFNPIEFYTGRGAFETIGAGLSMNPGEIAFKCNFAFVDHARNGAVSRRVDKHFSNESQQLCKYLQLELNRSDSWMKEEGISVHIKYATEHRCGVKIGKAGLALSDRMTGTDPLYDNMPLIRCQALFEDDEDATLASDIVQRVSDEITMLLLKHPINSDRLSQGKPIANALLFRGCSRTPSFVDFDAFHNVTWCPTMMARTCIISGIGHGIGFGIIPNSSSDSEGDSTLAIREDLLAYIDSFLKNQSCNFGFFHIKDVDEASHEHDFAHKIDLIQSIDDILKDCIEKITDVFESDTFRIVLTGDHTTLCRLGEHSSEPVPFLVSEPLSQSKVADTSDYEFPLSRCFYGNNIGRFSGECVVEFLRHLMEYK